MDAGIKIAIEAIHASPTQVVLHLAGGASQALGWLLSIPRASQTVLEATVPYARASMIQLLGKTPQQFVCPELADELATVAYNRGLTLSLPGAPVAGISFTGSLASYKPKLGDQRCYLSARTDSSIRRYHLTFSKGYRDRFGEDSVSSQMLIKALADVCDVGIAIPVDLKTPEEQLEESKITFSESEQLEQLINGNICMVRYAYQDVSGASRKVVLSGAFNPLHEGHLKLLEAACSLIEGGSPCFELSVINADKPPLRVDQINDRLKQFQEKGKTIIVTNQPLFYKKAEILLDSTFVIGVDTAMRLVNPRYYEGSISRMMEVIADIRKLGCDFIVAGRKMEGVYKTHADVNVPYELEDMFRPLPEDAFRIDISSTEIRASRQGAL